MAASARAPASKGRTLVTICVMLATIMQALDTSIANVALPHMQGSLQATQDQIAWVLTSYIVAAAIATPLTGWLAGRFGRKRLFLACVLGFTVASLLCGIAETLAQMVFYRLMQGVFGAALIPLSQATLLDVYPRERHGSAMAIWGSGIVVAPILGPTLGGWLTDTYTWRWVFYINLPVGILTIVGIWFFVAETATDRDRPFDFFGFATLSLCIGALQMMLDRGETNDWFGSTETWIELGLCITGLWVFLVHAATAEHPFISLALFKDRNFVAGSMLMFLIGILLYGTLALLPPLLQDLMNYPVVTTGLVLGAARARHARRDGRRRPAHRQDRRAASPRRGILRHRLFALAHDRLLARHGHVAGRHHHHHCKASAWGWCGCRFRPPRSSRCRSRSGPRARPSARSCATSAAASASRSARTCWCATSRSTIPRSRSSPHPYNPMMQLPSVHHAWNMDTTLGPRRAQRRGHAPGGDDRLSRRVQAVDDPDAGADPAAVCCCATRAAPPARRRLRSTRVRSAPRGTGAGRSRRCPPRPGA